VRSVQVRSTIIEFHGAVLVPRNHVVVIQYRLPIPIPGAAVHTVPQRAVKEQTRQETIVSEQCIGRSCTGQPRRGAA